MPSPRNDRWRAQPAARARLSRPSQGPQTPLPDGVTDQRPQPKGDGRREHAQQDLPAARPQNARAVTTVIAAPTSIRATALTAIEAATAPMPEATMNGDSGTIAPERKKEERSRGPRPKQTRRARPGRCRAPREPGCRPRGSGHRDDRFGHQARLVRREALGLVDERQFLFLLVRTWSSSSRSTLT